MPWRTKTGAGVWAGMSRAYPLSRDHIRARALFAKDSFWWKPLPASPPIASDSAAIVTNTLTPQVTRISLDRTSYTPQIVLARNTDPVVTFTFDASMGYTEHPQLISDHLTGIRIPVDAAPAAGTDQEVCIYNVDTRQYTDIWHATRTDATHWEAAYAGTIPDASVSNGVHTVPFGATASGLAFLPGMVGPDELAEGWIGHVIGIGLPRACLNNAVSAPANRTDGEGTGANLISEGQRLILPRTVNVDSLGLTRTGKIIARAAQEFGLIVWDRGETSTTIRAVNATGMTVDPYPQLLAGHATDPLAGFPVNQLQVMPRDWMPA